MKYKIYTIPSFQLERTIEIDGDWVLERLVPADGHCIIVLKSEETQTKKEENEKNISVSPKQEGAKRGIHGEIVYQGEATCMVCEAKTCRCYSKLIG